MPPDDLKPWVISVPEAGRRYFSRRWASYEAAKRGEIPTIRVGRYVFRVPVRVIERMLEHADAKTTA